MLGSSFTEVLMAVGSQKIEVYIHIHLQWNPSIVDTLGTWSSVQYREMSSFQG